MMKVSELIESCLGTPSDTKVTLLDPDKGWLLPIEIADLPADGLTREADFVAITSDCKSDERPHRQEQRLNHGRVLKWSIRR